MSKDIESLLYRFVFTFTPPEVTTYSSLINLIPEIESMLLDQLMAKKYSFQLEIGKESERLHFQGRFSLKSKKSIRRVLTIIKAFELMPQGPTGWQIHIDRERATEQVSELYTRKPDTAIDGTFTTSEKLHAPTYIPNDLYLDNKPAGKFAWQHQLEQYLLAPSTDHRTVDILSCPDGNNGKSVFIKRFVYKNPSDTFLCAITDNPTQVISSFISYVEHNGNVGPKVVLIDIPRAIDYGEKDCITLIKIHNLAELLRGGLVTSSMYGKYRSVLVTPPRVLIMTNYSYQGRHDNLWSPSNRFTIHRLAKSESATTIPSLATDFPASE